MANQAPDPARVYERAKPEAEGGMGRLHADKAPPAKQEDKMHQAVKNRQKNKQINAEDENAEPEKADGDAR